MINLDDLNTDQTKLKITKFLDIDFMNFTIPKTNSFNLAQSEQDYSNKINEKYGDSLKKDYEKFLDLFKKYESIFNKFYKIKKI